MVVDKVLLQESPLRVLRTSLGLDLNQVAKEVGVSESFLTMTELAVYENVSRKILDFYTKQIPHLSLTALESAYHTYQNEKRERFGEVYRGQVGEDVVEFQKSFPVDLSKSPIQVFRERIDPALSRAALAKNLCVQPAHLFKLEKGTAANIPLQLTIAFGDSGFPSWFVQELWERQGEFFVRSRRNKSGEGK